MSKSKKRQFRRHVVSFHSFKGGVGKTSLALATAAHLAQEARKAGTPGVSVCFVDLDFYGGLHFHLSDKCDVLSRLLVFDRASDQGLPSNVHVHVWCIPVTDEGGRRVDSVSVAYIGTNSSALRRIAPIAMSDWHSEYLLERVVKLIAKAATGTGYCIGADPQQEIYPQHFVVDCAPGLSGISLRLFHRSENEELLRGYEHKPVLVFTPQNSDCMALESWLKEDRPGRKYHPIVENMAVTHFDSARIFPPTAPRRNKKALQIHLPGLDMSNTSTSEMTESAVSTIAGNLKSSDEPDAAVRAISPDEPACSALLARLREAIKQQYISVPELTGVRSSAQQDPEEVCLSEAMLRGVIRILNFSA